MRHALAAGFLLLASGAAQAEEPVVVELFTSQGCSSCPPADRLLSELAARGDVIPLALHVDYWDYLGWRDEMADPDFTARQKRYAQRADTRTIYTPQIIVGGQKTVVGFRPMEIAQAIEAQRASASPISVRVVRRGEQVAVTLSPERDIGEVTVHLVRYRPEVTVDIHRGENAGRTITYSNVVTAWESIGRWSGQDEVTLTAPASGPEPVVVIAQEAAQGRILAAERLR
jgi:hypothetical protein